MTRKDTILIAVVINAGLLAVLFTTAVIYDTDKGTENMEFVAPLVDNKTSSIDSQSTLIAAVSMGDEVDNVLKYYTPAPAQPILVQSTQETFIPQSMVLQPNANEDEESSQSSGTSSTSSQEKFTEITVKRGDVLEKIARANKTSVSAIKRANQLESERLSIGQVLKIPTQQNAPLYATSGATVAQVEPIKAEPRPVKIEPKQEITKEPKADEPVYYVIKSGDNPWKIARQFGVKYDEILRLNQLDEEKARNLKIGDRVRVK